MSSEKVIRVNRVTKSYHIYERPRDRLKQFILSPLQRLVNRSPKQYFKEFCALSDVCFDIRKGESVGIVGQNGSGKSTLLQLICGTLAPTDGNIETCGRIAALLELGSGFNPEFTGRENVFLNGTILGLTKAEIEDKFSDIADFANIGEFIYQPVKTYSSGMVLRLAFAVAINVDPHILVVDEALAVGDELFQRKCFSRIEEIKSKGTTILLVSHSASSVIELCDRAILLDHGEILKIGKPRSVVNAYQKLLYAPEAQQASIRSSIRERTTQRLEVSGNTDSEIFSHVAEALLSDREPKEIFDEGLVPQSTVVFESRGAVIGDVGLYAPNGERVNGLVRGREYRFRYGVEFEKAVRNVRFAMLIKTASGLPLGGALSAPSISKAIPLVEEGRRYLVEYSFRCYLNPGIYFTNAGIFGCDNSDEETVIHRKADVSAFRVLPVDADCATEVIDFDFECRATLDA